MGMSFDPQQRRVVQHVIGSLLVMAPAGTGKTSLLAARAVAALETGFRAEEMLCLTFTNLAARQLRESVEKALPRFAPHIWMSTFHGFCASVLRVEAKNVGLPGDYVIYDEEDSKELLSHIMSRSGTVVAEKPAEILLRFGKAKSKAAGVSLRLRGYDGSDLPKPYRQLHTRYVAELRARHALDFSDLIYYVRAIFNNSENIKEKWAHRFSFIQIDEVQDTHLAEYDVIRTLASEGNIAFFGDLDQSIYGWRGSTPVEVKDRLVSDFKPTQISLPRNYRATKKLLRAADGFASAFTNRYTQLIPDDTCPDGTSIKVHHAETESQEAQWISEHIQRLKASSDCGYNDIAVLCRTNKKSQQIGTALEEANIPTLTVEQYQFFRRQEIKDALCFVKLLLNAHDTSAAQRITLRYVENVGVATVNRILNADARLGIRLPDFLNGDTFIHDDPFGLLIDAYSNGSIVVIDTETTGLSPFEDNVIELAYCVLDHAEPVKEMQAYVRSDKLVAASVHVHGITDAVLEREGKDPAIVLQMLRDDYVGSLVVGHNVTFDIAMIRAQSSRQGIDTSALSYADTYELARRFISSDSYQLGDLSKTLNLRTSSTHRAMDDVKATVELLHKLMPHILKTQTKRRKFVVKHRREFHSFAGRLLHFRREANKQRPGKLLESILTEFGVLDAFRDEPRRVANLMHLVSVFRERDPTSMNPLDALQVLVQFTSLAKNIDHLSAKSNKVIVAPIHQSKGLEFKSVFIAGAVDGFIPIFNSSDMEEEKRLFYVAMTRPKKHLFISGFQVYVTEGGCRYPKSMTPFLRHVDTSLIEWC